MEANVANKDELEFYETPYSELDALLRGDVPITCSRCGDSLECPITNEPCPLCVKGGEVGRAKPPTHELGTMVLPWAIQVNVLHPSPPRRNHPFSLHLLEWIHVGHGWWGSLFGYYPRVGEGEVDGHSWHFHARGKRWVLVVGTTPTSWAEDEWADGMGEYHIIGQYPCITGSAGEMEEEEAWEIIEDGIARWREVMAKQFDEVVGRWEGEGGR